MQRFGLEGLEALMPGMIALVERCAAHGVHRMEVGMPHRGRLSLLCNLLGKPPGALFGEMEGRQSEFHVGDVKYHLGQSATLACPIQVRSTAGMLEFATRLLPPSTLIILSATLLWKLDCNGWHERGNQAI